MNALRAAIASRLEAIAPATTELRVRGPRVEIWYNGEHWAGLGEGGEVDLSNVASYARQLASNFQDTICQATTEPWPRPPGTSGPIPVADAEVRDGELFIWFGPSQPPVLACQPIPLDQFKLSATTRSTVELLSVARTGWHAIAEDPVAFAGVRRLALGADPETLRAVGRQTLALHERTGAFREPWTGFLAVDRARHTIVGTCGFKAPPDPEGVAEIAYFTFPDFEGQGVATEMAAQLIGRVGQEPIVRRLVAHTLPEHNPSTRILEKLGFARTGEVVGPDEEPVWRWELPVLR